MVGSYSVSYPSRADNHSRNQNHGLARVLTVGDTGFEPVTSGLVATLCLEREFGC
jgi:hypothetical protein